MKGLFNADSPLMRALSRLADLIVLNVLLITLSLPLVTLGAAVTALWDVTLRLAEDREDSVFRGFFRAFRRNFRQSTAIWLLLLAAGIPVGLNLYAALFTEVTGSLRAVLAPCSVLLALLWLMVLSWVFLLQARFENPVKTTLKNALLLALTRAPLSFLLAAVPAACLWLTLRFPESFVFWGFLGYALAAFLLAKPVLRALSKI